MNNDKQQNLKTVPLSGGQVEPIVSKIGDTTPCPYCSEPEAFIMKDAKYKSIKISSFCGVCGGDLRRFHKIVPSSLTPSL